MKLSNLEKYIIDMVCDDYYGLWEVISYDDYLIEAGIGYDPIEIKKAVKKLILKGYIEMVSGNLQTGHVSVQPKKNATIILKKAENWETPSNLEDVYAVGATETGEQQITTNGLIVDRSGSGSMG